MNQEIEKAMTGGIVFKGHKERPKEEPKIHRPARLRCRQDESRDTTQTRQPEQEINKNT